MCVDLVCKSRALERKKKKKAGAGGNITISKSLVIAKGVNCDRGPISLLLLLFILLSRNRPGKDHRGNHNHCAQVEHHVTIEHRDIYGPIPPSTREFIVKRPAEDDTRNRGAHTASQRCARLNIIPPCPPPPGAK